MFVNAVKVGRHEKNVTPKHVIFYTIYVIKMI